MPYAPVSTQRACGRRFGSDIPGFGAGMVTLSPRAPTGFSIRGASLRPVFLRSRNSISAIVCLVVTPSRSPCWAAFLRWAEEVRYINS